MRTTYEHLVDITYETTSRDRRVQAMKSLARDLDWNPSYEISGSYGVKGVEDHLVVEHGLGNSAVLTFLKGSRRAADLGTPELRALLQLSYNNLVEWHVFVSQSDILYVSNLTKPLVQHSLPVSRTSLIDDLSSSNVRRFINIDGFRRNVRACDEALIQVISRWKRLLKADVPGIDNRHLSALFNAIIFVRGCEDWRAESAPGPKGLIEALQASAGPEVDLGAILDDALRRAGMADDTLRSYIHRERLAPFARCDRATAVGVLQDFYLPSEAAYGFNFALMSKHALSRIYERYIELMEPGEDTSSQLAFLNPLPTVRRNAAQAGTVYTPQFIAGFFARYIRVNTTPRAFGTLRSTDPACGSGIFLRTLLELQCDPFMADTTEASIRECFRRVDAIDRDPNACEATRLSIALLHLVATGALPEVLAVRNLDAIAAALAGELLLGTHDVVITNPPYVSWARLTEEERALYRDYLGEAATGRPDAYLAFIKLCIELVRPSGFVCLVLPQIFLQASNAFPLRQRIAAAFDVRCLVDLSSVPVFEGVGAYPILLVIQRRPEGVIESVDAQVAQVTDENVGSALQACLEGTDVEDPRFRTFSVSQRFFAKKEWVILAPEDLRLEGWLEGHEPLSRFMKVSQGLNTGADDVFIRPRGIVPKGEEAIYRPFLPDRQILRYSLPRSTDRVVIYPFNDGQPLGEAEMRGRYPTTWRYLEDNPQLRPRRERAPGAAWWLPERARRPEELLGPKIVGPHLMLSPRFAVDVRGTYVVSRSIFLAPLSPDDDLVSLWFYCGVLNSSLSNWFLNTHAPRYGRGYSRLEVRLLSSMPVPSPTDKPSLTLEVARMVERLSTGSSSQKAVEEQDAAIDELVLEAYGLSSAERRRLRGNG